MDNESEGVPLFQRCSGGKEMPRRNSSHWLDVFIKMPLGLHLHRESVINGVLVCTVLHISFKLLSKRKKGGGASSNEEALVITHC